MDGGSQHEVSDARGWVDRQIERMIAVAQNAGWFDPDDAATVDRLADMVIELPCRRRHRYAVREFQVAGGDDR